MRRITFLLLIVACLTTGCSRVHKQLRGRITNCDSVAINYFKGNGTMDTVVLVKIISDKNTLDQLSNLITKNVIKGNPNCGYDGSLHFFKSNEVVQDIYFSMNNDDCTQFYFSFNREKNASELSAEAKKILQGLKH